MELTIGKETIRSGEKKNLTLPVTEKTHLPLTVICGKRPGKTALISAGVHGAEYLGIQAVLELSRELEPEDVSGTILFLLDANWEATVRFARWVVPEDGQNLNRAFPGDPHGSLSKKIAHVMAEELQKKADFYLDIHCGDIHEQVMPFVYYAGVAKDEVVEEARQMAMAADMAVRTRSGATSGANNYAAACQIPSLLLERGGNGIVTRSGVEAYKRDIRNILKFQNVLKGEPVHTVRQREVVSARYIDSTREGLWYPRFGAGECFKKGEILGEVCDIWGKRLECVTAGYDGIILYETVGMGVRPGESLVAYGRFQNSQNL
ncbi:MAG: M14 family metallopeptidase [Lachnospiraceae bacterium]|nr:succinylglutamate desuccinylase/aspartoacylase family protein [Candidatus Fimimorpha excrementavium]